MAQNLTNTSDETRTAILSLQRLMIYASEEYQRHGYSVASHLCMLAQTTAHNEITCQMAKVAAAARELEETV